MRQMTCTHCGKVFDSPRGRTTCSDACKKAHKYEQNRRRTPEYNRIGAMVKCQWCDKIFKRTAVGQKYCSLRCQERARNKHTAAKAKTIPATCVICDKPFLTSASAMARTCGKECLLKLRSRLAKERAADKKPYLKADDSFCMPCPWATHKLDTLPPGVASWDCPEMDPMSTGFPMITFSVPVAREVAA